MIHVSAVRRPGPHLLRGALVLAGVSACAGRGAPTVHEQPRLPNGPAVVIDGEFLDWAPRPEVARVAPAAANGRLVLGQVRVRHDASAVYFLLDLGRTVNLQMLGAGTLTLTLDTDGDATTGEPADGVAGADLQVVFSPVRNASGVGSGVLLRVPGDTTWYDGALGGLYYAPTHASDRFEIRLARGAVIAPGAVPAFSRSALAARLVLRDGSGGQLDATDALSHRLDAGRGGPRPAEATAVRRAAGSDLRVLTWNMGDEGLLQSPDPYRRTIAALDPDLVLMDELHPSLDQAWLESFVGRWPRGPWRVLVGAGGGRQRTAVASRLPVERLPSLARVEYPDSLRALFGLPVSRQMGNDLRTAFADGIPTMGARLQAGKARVLVMPMDFFCCGGMGGPDDRARVMVADAIRAAARREIDGGRVDAVILGGDLNLVGSRRPLDVLRRNLDPAGGDLAAAPAYRLNGLSNTTWRAPGPFPPGRLDYLLVSGSRFRILRSFAFDPADLTPLARRELGLAGGDDTVTDHLPVVVDLALRR